MEKTISFTKVKLPFGWLGNMSPYPITHMGKIWKSTEALFQALRFNDEVIQEAIRNEPNPMVCKMKIKAIIKQLTKDGELHKRSVWPQSIKDLENMELCVRLKIEQHKEIKKMLLSTAGYFIYEDVTLRGRKGSNLFWGALKNSDGKWEGENHLGKIWMKLREEIIDYYKKMPLKVTSSKFGLEEDPYKILKDFYEKGFDISVLRTDDMRWYIPVNEIDWSLPPQCYRVISPSDGKIIADYSNL